MRETEISENIKSFFQLTSNKTGKFLLCYVNIQPSPSLYHQVNA